MNKFLLGASLALAALIFVPNAQAASPAHGGDAGFFIGARAGQGYFNGNQNLHSTTYSIDLGYRWALNSHNSLGFQAGYVRPDDLEDSYYGYRLQTHAYTLGATYRLTFAGRSSGPHWFFSARVGYMHWTQDEHGTDGYSYPYGPSYGSSSVYSSNASGTGSYAGLGIGFDFNDHVGLGLHYDYYLANLYDDGYGNYSADGLSVPSVGVEIRF